MDKKLFERLGPNLIDTTFDEYSAEYETLPSDEESVIEELEQNDKFEEEQT